MKKSKYFILNSNFDKIIESYIVTIGTVVRPSTINAYKESFKNFFCYITTQYPEIANLSELKRSPHIDGWLSYLAASGLKTGSRRLRILYIKKFFNDIYEWGWEDTPQSELLTSKDFPPLDKYLPKPLTPENDMKLKEYLRSQNTLMAQAFLLLRKTGMRIGELRDLEKDCFEKISDGKYTLRVPIGKLHNDRIIPVDEETVEIINRIIKLRGSQTPLLNSRTGKLTEFLIVMKNCKRPSYAGLRAAFLSAVEKSGIQIHITLHQCRHTFATELLRADINLVALMKLLGHRDIRMTLRYTGVSSIDLQNAYFNALEKNQSTNLLLKSEDNILQNINELNKPNLILNGINNLIIAINSFSKDSTEKIYKKKLQRITERLRKIYYLVEDILIIH